MDPAEALRTFVVVFPAELPDKTMLASVVLVLRFRRPTAVWSGAAAAFAVHVVVAVLAGQILSALPTRLVASVVGVLFAVGAVVMYRQRNEAVPTTPAPVQVQVAGPAAEPASWWRAAGVSFGIVLLAEWGDLTQLLTAGLAATSDAPLMVGLGALLALWSVSALAVVLGRTLVARVPVRIVRTIAVVVFSALAVASAVEAIRN